MRMYDQPALAIITLERLLMLYRRVNPQKLHATFVTQELTLLMHPS